MNYDMNYIDRILQTYSDRTWISGSVSKEQVAAAASRLGMTFPEDYRIFLERYGTVEFGSVEIYGILPDSPQSVPDAVWTTEKLCRDYGLKQGLAVLGFDGFGGYFCLDTVNTGEDGKCPVVLFVMEAQRQEYEALYESFTDFLFEQFKEEARTFKA